MRASWDEATEIIAAANAHTAKTWGPDRVIGFSPIPAMSMVSYAAGCATCPARRHLHVVLRLVLRPAAGLARRPGASRPTCRKVRTGTTPASLILWGRTCRRPGRRTRISTEARYRGAKSVVICPDYSEAAKFGDIWLSPTGTDSALAMAMGHVILREFHLDRQADISRTIAAATPTCRSWSGWRAGRWPARPRAGYCAPRTSPTRWARANNPDWKTIGRDDATGAPVVPNGSVGFRWGESGKWNLGAEGRRAEVRCA